MSAAASGTPVAVAWLGLGANLGNRSRALARLRELLEARPGVAIEAASAPRMTRAVGFRAQPDFLNQVVRCRAEPPLTAAAWLDVCRQAESDAGRRPTYRWGPRRADADILLLGDRGEVRVETPDLQVPHPALGDRPFFVAQLAELDGGLRHPDGWLVADRAAEGATPRGQMGSRSAS